MVGTKTTGLTAVIAGAAAVLAACGQGGEQGGGDGAGTDAGAFTTTDTGLQYRVIEAGPESGPLAQSNDVACVHYRGTLEDGTQFDASYDRGQAAAFPVQGVIPGWTEALQLMRPGDHYELIIPPELAYGPAGAGGLIGPNATLNFTVELIDLRTSMPARGTDCADEDYLMQKRGNLREAEAFLSNNRGQDGVTETDSGLQYRVLDIGAPEGRSPAPGQYVCVHYRGERLDGTEFDSSYSRDMPAAFPSDRLIQGWVEALAMMRPGDRWQLFIHPDLAYGENPRGDVIQANDLLVFEVSMLGLLDGPVGPGVDCSASE